MTQKGITLAFTVILLASGIAAVHAQVHAGAPVQAASWSPKPYTDGGSLPSNFKGLDVKRLWEFLKSKQKAMVKGEYETTDEFKRRQAASASDTAPLALGDEYALALQGVELTYNADTQMYSAEKSRWCEKTPNYGPDKGWFVCTIGEIYKNESQYVGSNAFGLKRTIDKTVGKNFGIAIPENAQVLKNEVFPYGSLNRLISTQDLKVKFHVPLKEARDVKSSNIGVLLVGRFDSIKIIEGPSTLISPTIDIPYDTFIMEDAVPFTPTILLLYVEDTGQILAVKKL